MIRYRRPKDRRSRADQWSAAIDTLTDCSTDIRSGATSLTNYRLPICRVDLDGTERLPLATAVATQKQHGATLDKSGLTILPGHGSVCGMMAPPGRPNHHPTLIGLPLPPRISLSAGRKSLLQSDRRLKNEGTAPQIEPRNCSLLCKFSSHGSDLRHRGAVHEAWTFGGRPRLRGVLTVALACCGRRRLSGTRSAC